MAPLTRLRSARNSMSADPKNRACPTQAPTGKCGPTQWVTVQSVSAAALEQEPQATHEEHWTPVLSKLRSMRKDSLASSHGRSPGAGVVLPGASAP